MGQPGVLIFASFALPFGQLVLPLAEVNLLRIHRRRLVGFAAELRQDVPRRDPLFSLLDPPRNSPLGHWPLEFLSEGCSDVDLLHPFQDTESISRNGFIGRWRQLVFGARRGLLSW